MAAKHDITKIGNIMETWEGDYFLQGWEFEPPVWFNVIQGRSSILGGWSMKDLTELAKACGAEYRPLRIVNSTFPSIE